LPFLPASVSTPRSDARREERGERNCKIAKNFPEDQMLTDKFKVSEVKSRNSFGLTRNDTILSLELRGNVSTCPRFAPCYPDKAGDTFPAIYDAGEDIVG
jgi:hypothetical protein